MGGADVRPHGAVLLAGNVGEGEQGARVDQFRHYDSALAFEGAVLSCASRALRPGDQPSIGSISAAKISSSRPAQSGSPLSPMPTNAGSWRGGRCASMY